MTQTAFSNNVTGIKQCVWDKVGGYVAYMIFFSVVMNYTWVFQIALMRMVKVMTD